MPSQAALLQRKPPPELLASLQILGAPSPHEASGVSSLRMDGAAKKLPLVEQKPSVGQCNRK